MTFQAIVKRWVDGDTVDADVDLGFSIWSKQRFRLARINTPERKQEGYSEALAFANTQLPEYQPCRLVCHGKDRYGRWIADVYSGNATVSVNDQLLQAGLAKFYVE